MARRGGRADSARLPGTSCARSHRRASNSERIADRFAEKISAFRLAGFKARAVAGSAGEDDRKAFRLQARLIVPQHLEGRAALRQRVVDKGDLALDCSEACPAGGADRRERTFEKGGLVILRHLVGDDLGALVAADQRMVGTAFDIGRMGGDGTCGKKRRAKHCHPASMHHLTFLIAVAPPSWDCGSG